MKRVRIGLRIFCLAVLGTALTGCKYTSNDFSKGWNIFIYAIGIAALAVLLFFIAAGVVSVFYKGKDHSVKILKKKETKVLRGGMMGRGSPGYKNQTDLSRKARREKSRLRYNKVIVELDGKKKTLKCNDIVLFDKLSVGKIQRVRIRFNEIVKVLKN